MRITPLLIPRVLTALILTPAVGLTAGCSHDTVRTAVQMHGPTPPVPQPRRDASGHVIGPPAGVSVAHH